jgi:hypothetical protein
VLERSAEPVGKGKLLASVHIELGQKGGIIAAISVLKI